jgi:hypothetical protein
MAPSANLSLRRKPGSTRKAVSSKAMRCRRKFLSFFRGGFRDPKYLDWERDYKWDAHERWQEVLSRAEFGRLLRSGEYAEIAARAIRVEQSSRHSMIFSFEKMALRDAVKSPAGARTFSEGLFNFLHGRAAPEKRFEAWVAAIASLPRKQTRVLTWPVVTVFGFLAQPDEHIFLKPIVVRAAAEEYGFDFLYRSRPAWETYASLLEFAALLRRDLADLKPRDMIDIQSFMWVQGSSEYS